MKSKTARSASATIRRWPARDFFKEFRSATDADDPIDVLITRDPRVSRLRKAVSRLAGRVHEQVNAQDWIALADAYALLRATEVEAGFNLGFENGVVRERSETAARRRHRAAISPAEAEFRTELRRMLAASPLPAAAVTSALLELSWALVREPRHARLGA